MSNIKDYKCPNCGDSLVFDGPTQTLNCESCDSHFDVKTIEQIVDMDTEVEAPSKFDWDKYEERNFNGENINFSTYNCPSCGASVTGDDTMGSTICPYCGNATIVKGQFEGSLMPDYIIPFKYDKDMAVDEFEKKASKAPFIPNLFKDKKIIEEMAGLYVPYWTFDCDCNASITYKGNRTSTWSDADYIYTKTDYFKLYRFGKIGFDKIPVDGSTKIEAEYSESVEPFNYNEAVDFNSAYLAGYLTDKYDVSPEECITRANERVQLSTEQAFLQTTGGYMGVIKENSNISFSNNKIRYALLPIWMLNIKYNNEMYKYAINGQTGKVVGKYPIDKSKKNKYFWKTWAISVAIIGLIALGINLVL